MGKEQHSLKVVIVMIVNSTILITYLLKWLLPNFMRESLNSCVDFALLSRLMWNLKDNHSFE